MSLENKFFKKIVRKAAPYIVSFGLGFAAASCLPIEKIWKNLTEKEKEIVILGMDDFQIWYKENIQDYIIQRHIDEKIPVTLGVIPKNIDFEYESGIKFREKLKKWDKEPLLEVAQHGYDHARPPLEGQSYDFQYNKIKKGKDLMNKIGVDVKSFIPAFGLADDTSINIIRDLDFHTFYSPEYLINLSITNNPFIIRDQIMLCVDNKAGKDSVFKDYDSVKKEIDQKIEQYGVALVLYHMQDFEAKDDSIDTERADQLVDYAKRLKKEYNLMTVEQYYQHLQKKK